MAPQTTNTVDEARTCRCCGAVLPVHLVERLEDVKGLEHAKRALEVAASGNHTIVFLGEGNYADARRLAEIARTSFNMTAFVLSSCPCGYLGSASRTCLCRPAVVARYQKRPTWKKAQEHGELWVSIPEVSHERITSARRGEPDEHVKERIALAQGRAEVSTDLSDGAAMRLMQAATRQLHFDQTTHHRVCRIAATIARLDGRETIGPAHLAEAIQYRPRIEQSVED